MLVEIAADCFINPLEVVCVRKDPQAGKVLVEKNNNLLTIVEAGNNLTLDEVFSFVVNAINDELRRLKK